MSDAAAQASHGLLSVVIPVYNVLPYLRECVESVCAQTYADLEAILVDDGSTDGSGALCEELAAADPRLRVLHQKNAGQAAARNAGLDAARGAWIGFLDSDDRVAPDMYARLIRLCAESGAEAGSCAFAYEFENRTESSGDSGETRVYTRAEALERLPLEEDVRFEVCPKVYRRDVVGNVRFQPGQLHEEIRFTRLTFPRITRFAYIDCPLYRYRQQRAGNTASYFSPAKAEAVAECDALLKDLRAAQQNLAADRMEAFTLEFLIRLYVSARTNGADRATLARIRSMYRTRFSAARRNPCVRKLRGALFYVSPALYDEISKRLHRRA